VPEVGVSCCVLVLVDQATKQVSATQPAHVRPTPCTSNLRRHRRRMTKAAVRAALVVVLDVASQNANSCWRPTISNWSRHSRRTVPTHRSATALALGACIGVTMTSLPVGRQTSSNALLNLVSRSRIRNFHAPVCSPRLTTRFRPSQSEVGRRRGARGGGPFPSAPSRTGLASFPAPCSPVITSGCVFPDDVQHRCGAPHYADLALLDPLITCAPSPCGRLSRPPWWDVAPTTTTGTPSP